MFTLISSRMIPAVIIGFTLHVLVTLSARNESLDYVVKSSASSWLQEHMTDLSERFLSDRYTPETSCIDEYIGVSLPSTPRGNYIA